MPAYVTIARENAVGNIAGGWSVQLDAMAHSPLTGAGTVGQVSFSAATEAQTHLVMYNDSVFTYYYPFGADEVRTRATIPLPPPVINPPPPTGGVGWGQGTWGGNGWGGTVVPGGGDGSGSGWSTEAWGTDPWGA